MGGVLCSVTARLIVPTDGRDWLHVGQVQVVALTVKSRLGIVLY